MQLNELIEKEGLENISLKTNISLENLQNLQNETFEKLNRVKSLGFINILEREYSVQLEEIREKIKEYFDDHHSAKDDEVVMLSPDRVEESGSGFFKWLVIFAILYGLWYLYSNGKLDSFFSKADSKETLLGDYKALESNTTQAQADTVVVDIQNKEEVVTIDPNKKKSESPTQEGHNVTPSKDEVASTSADGQQAVEAQNSEETSDNKASDEAVITEKVVEVEKSVPTTGQEDETKAESTESNQSIKSSNEDEEKAKIIYNLTINPTRGMLWYGFINIDTKERREFMKKTSTPFELDGGRWILVTGHGYLEIVSDVSTVKVTKNVRKKHYFYLDSSEIKEIDRKEFRTLNGGRGW